jgi:hypothetical protein
MPETDVFETYGVVIDRFYYEMWKRVELCCRRRDCLGEHQFAWLSGFGPPGS